MKRTQAEYLYAKRLKAGRSLIETFVSKCVYLAHFTPSKSAERDGVSLRLLRGRTSPSVLMSEAIELRADWTSH